MKGREITCCTDCVYNRLHFDGFVFFASLIIHLEVVGVARCVATVLITDTIVANVVFTIKLAK